MAATRTITQHIRFLFTAVTLFCVLLLNNQEVPTYSSVAAKANPENNSHLQSSKKQKTIVKQKVSFEATNTYFVLHLVDLTRWLSFDFFNPVRVTVKLLPLQESFIPFFRVFLGFTIIPNAP
ncbi:hypothetical protein HUW51_16610 [Adhaeribacter swui]|uniref:Uncharacterized protein n=1 Tax=Adhaeribacter swui TaxID=2086471 RepID=A0A7G7GAS9_9BACT|nr:hypothetical protein [Adhaeribacter swui]QNF34263.1 hypothetical protein HUW51_16610 [Adhaeribacter swui]